MPNQQRPVLKARLEQLISLVGGLMARYPRTIALFGFCSGVFSFIMVDRQKASPRCWRSSCWSVGSG